MPKLDKFTQFYGRHWTTGSIAAALDYMGAKNPLTGRPFTEAFLLGVSGGLAFGYFTFDYKGFDPQVNILTRNTFNNYGWDAITARLGLAQDVVHSTSADKAQKKLIEALEEGRPPIVWADTYTLGHERSDFGDNMWMMVPVVVTAYEAGGAATIVDRATSPIEIDANLLDKARGRVKKDKYRMILLEPPPYSFGGAGSPGKPAGAAPGEPAGVGPGQGGAEALTNAVKEGLAECMELYTEKPPAGSAQSFGFKGYRRWAELLTKPKGAGTWAATFTDGRRLHAALSTAYTYALLYCKGDEKDAERGLFADFLDEAVDGAGRAAELFREAGALWSGLGDVLLPATVSLLGRTRETLERRHKLFREAGASPELETIDSELDGLREQAAEGLGGAADHGEILTAAAEVVREICSTEEAAIEELSALPLEI